MSHHAAIQDHNPAGHRGPRGDEEENRRITTQWERRKTIPQSPELQRCCFQLAACGFSVLVHRIISSKCNHNWQAAMFGLAVRACGNLLQREPPGEVLVGGRVHSTPPDSAPLIQNMTGDRQIRMKWSKSDQNMLPLQTD